MVTIKDGKGSFRFHDTRREKILRDLFEKPVSSFVAGGKTPEGVHWDAGTTHPAWSKEAIELIIGDKLRGYNLGGKIMDDSAAATEKKMKSGNRTFITIALALVAVFCVCCLCGSAALVASIQLGLPEQLGIVPAMPNATSDVAFSTPRATQDAKTRASDTSTPRTTPRTGTPIITAPAGTSAPLPPLASVLPGVLFHDDFSSEDMSRVNGWKFGKSDNTEVTWSPNKLTMAFAKGLSRFDDLKGDYTDLAIEIEAQPKTEEITYGIFFRSSPSGEKCENCYSFLAAPNGEYFLYKKIGAKSEALVQGKTSYIQSGTNKNRLGVLVSGSSFSLYINGHLVKTISDSSLASGAAGIVGVSVGTVQQEVSFNRVTVLTPQRGKVELAKTDNQLGASLAGVLFYDDFSSEQVSQAKGWMFGVDSVWSPNKYTMSVKGKELIQWIVPPFPALGDFGVEVEVQPEDLADSRYGIVFRVHKNQNEDEYYCFGATRDGKYLLSKRVGGRWSVPLTLTTSTLLKPGAAKNRLGVLAQGTSLSLFINGTLVKTIVDDSIKSGSVGLYVQSGTQDSARAAFSSMTVFTLERTKAEWDAQIAARGPTASVLFQDDFSSEQASKENGWNFRSTDVVETTWSLNKLAMKVKQKEKLNTTCFNQTFQNFAAEIEAQPGGDAGTEYGIVFRFRGNPDNYLMFGARLDGSLYLLKIENDKMVYAAPTKYTLPARIQSGAVKNRLGVIADGALLSLYVNGDFFQTVIVDAPSQNGFVCAFVQAQGDRAQLDVSRVMVLSVEQAKVAWNGYASGILLRDNFSAEQSSKNLGFVSQTNANSEQVWSPGKFMITVKKAQSVELVVLPPGPLADFGIEIEAEPARSGSAEYGLFFRLAEGESNVSHYVFAARSDGTYYLGKKINGKWAKPDLVEATPSPFLKPAPNRNRLGVIVEGATISLYINGNLVKTVKDDSIKSGLVTIYVGAGTDLASVALTRVTLYTVEKAKTELSARAEAITPAPLPTTAATSAPRPGATYPPGILFHDDFSSEQASKDKGWVFGTIGDVDAIWSLNKLTLTVKNKNTVGRRIPTLPSRSDFGVEVEAQPEDNPGTKYGIAFRYGETLNTRSYYLFAVTVDGKYYLHKLVGGKWSDIDPVSLTPSSFIKPGASKNRLGVLAEGTKISLYINGNLVNTITDDSIASGWAGFAVITGDNPLARVAFNRLTIYTVEKAKTELGKR